jgi:hypothetical protein
MNTFLFDQKLNQGNLRDRDVLSAFRRTPEKSTEIRHGMSPQEIAEIVSDRLMTIVKDQFEAAKRQFRESGNK